MTAKEFTETVSDMFAVMLTISVFVAMAALLVDGTIVMFVSINTLYHFAWIHQFTKFMWMASGGFLVAFIVTAMVGDSLED